MSPGLYPAATIPFPPSRNEVRDFPFPERTEKRDIKSAEWERSRSNAHVSIENGWQGLCFKRFLKTETYVYEADSRFARTRKELC